MKGARYRLSPAAQRDLSEIEAFLEQHAPGSMDGVLDEIEAACSPVGERPDAGRARVEIDRDVRSFPVGTYVIFYYSNMRPVGIARILHGRRDLGSIFRIP